MKKLTVNQKIEILQKNYDEILKNHLCGMYLGFELPNGIVKEYHWEIIAKKYNYFLICYTDSKPIKLKYDFFFSFDENLQALFEKTYNHELLQIGA